MNGSKEEGLASFSLHVSPSIAARSYFQPFLYFRIPPYHKMFALKFRGSPIGFFNPVIPTQNFVQSRNPEGYFWHPISRVYFQSRISPRFCFQVPNPELQIREIPHPEKPIGDPQFSINCYFQVPLKELYITTRPFENNKQ